MYTLPLLITDSYIFPTGQLPGGTIGKSVMDFRIFSGILEKYKVFNISDWGQHNILLLLDWKNNNKPI